MANNRKGSTPSFRSDQSVSLLEGVTGFADEEYDYEDEFNEDELEMEPETDEPIIGKRGAAYMRHGAFNLTTQQYPNAPNVVC